MRILNSHRIKIRRRAIQVLLMVVLTSCLSPLDFPVEIIGGRIVVTGQISTIAERNLIEVGTTSSSLQLPGPYSNAKVEVIDVEGTVITYTEDPVKIGNYRGETPGIPGHTYYARITLPGGKVYESKPETMPSDAGTVSAYHTFTQQDLVDAEGTVINLHQVNVYANSSIPIGQDPTYLKWNVEEVFLLVPTDFPDPFGNIPPSCYVTQPADAQKVTLFDGSNTRTDTLSNQLLVTRAIDKSFYTRYYSTVIQSATTAEAFEYWRKVNILSNQVGSIFDTPPAEISGNISNVQNPSEKVAGYFQAVNQTVDRFFLVRSDLPKFLPTYCDFSEERDWRSYPSECLNCLTMRNSSYERPDWFGE
jgi:hypothetical protein